jgi:hypothetical protein
MRFNPANSGCFLYFQAYPHINAKITPHPSPPMTTCIRIREPALPVTQLARPELTNTPLFRPAPPETAGRETKLEQKKSLQPLSNLTTTFDTHPSPCRWFTLSNTLVYTQELIFRDLQNGLTSSRRPRGRQTIPITMGFSLPRGKSLRKRTHVLQNQFRSRQTRKEKKEKKSSNTIFAI